MSTKIHTPPGAITPGRTSSPTPKAGETPAAAPARAQAPGARAKADRFEGGRSIAARGPAAGTTTPGTVSGSIAPNLPIQDNSTVTSTLALSEDVTVDALKLDLDIAHTYRGDLAVTLTSPSGKQAVISNRQGGGADDLRGRFDLSAFKGESAKGTWTLTVQDTASRDVGTLERWGLTITPKADQPPPPPADDSDPMKHIAVLSSDEMKGRDSPSPELSAAAAHVTQYAQKYGLVGPNTLNPSDPYQQKFKVYSYATPEGRALQPHPEHSQDKKSWGHKLFDNGFYLEEGMSRDSLELINRKYEQLSQESGAALVPPRQGELRGVEELKRLAQYDGTVQNTLALLPGTGPHKDEVLVVMAHLDHVGVGSDGSVHNGADDNASGSAVLMSAIPELVEAQKRGELDRSVLFVWTGAEEKGLVGSQYFVDHPIPGLGLDKINGVINVDMIGRWDDERLSVIDSNSRGQANYFRDVLDKANQRMADPFDRLNRDINVYRDRHDGAPFTRKGEDVLFLFEGLSNPQGGGDLMPDYHGPGDDLDKIVRDNGGEKPRRVKDLVINLIKLSSTRPAAPAPR